jgi:hypothetical protein
VREIETNLQIDHRFTHYAEAEVARLDDAHMHRADRDLILKLECHQGIAGLQETGDFIISFTSI